MIFLLLSVSLDTQKFPPEFKGSSRAQFYLFGCLWKPKYVYCKLKITSISVLLELKKDVT